MATFIDKGQGNYEILTDAPIEVVNDISVRLYLYWIDFALGHISLNGETIKHPTGDYASLIEKHSQGHLGVTISADGIVPTVLELGHKEYDMKNDIFMNKSWPMHREARVYTGHSPKVPISAKGDRGWVIPAMRGMHPARTLAILAADALP